MSGTKYGIRQGPAGEVMVSTHGSEDVNKFGRSALGKVLG